MKKLGLTALVLFIVVLNISAAGIAAHFAGLSKGGASVVYPSDSKIGATCFVRTSTETEWLEDTLYKEFNLEWTESSFAEESAKALSSIYSQKLSQLLPAQDFIMSKPLVNADGSCSIAVRFSNSDVITFVVFENKICGMTN